MKTLKLFFRKYAVYLIIAFCVLAIGLSMILVFASGNNGESNVINSQVEKPDVYQQIPIDDTEEVVKKSEGEEVTEPVVNKIVYSLPVLSFTGIGEYSENLTFNSTLNRYQAHRATDFYAEEGTSVLAISDGTVESVTNDLLKGYTVIIDHGNGLKSMYNSLLDGDSVVAGQKVKGGDVIGEVSCSNRQEYKEGAHLHFELLENGVSIDPEKYLLIEDK